MKMSEMSIGVTADFSQVKHEMDLFERQIITLGHTVERLNENGIEVKLKIGVQPKTIVEKLVSFVSGR